MATALAGAGHSSANKTEPIPIKISSVNVNEVVLRLRSNGVFPIRDST